MENMHYDVVIVGGGFAGATAALAAARGGARVLLLERSNSLGGAAAVNLVMPFMKYSTRVGEELKFLSRGIFEEITRELCGFNGSKHASKFDEELLKLILNRKCVESGVQLLFGATLCGVDTEGDRIKALTVATVGGCLTFTAPVFIDATGDATLAFMAGCACRVGREQDGLCQPMTLCFRATGIDKATFLAARKQVNGAYVLEKEAGRIQNPRENVLYFDTVHDGIVHFNTTRVVRLDPTNPFDVTAAELQAREQVFEMIEFLRAHAPGCEHIALLSTAIGIGVRESRMIEGEHVLTEEEIKACTVFPDSIALGNYDIDIHNPEGEGTSHYYFPEGEFYTIPYRTLLPRDRANLLVAGRCISATHEAQASIRIMPIVACLGEAAGTAAAIAVKAGKGPKEIDVTELRATLEKNGAAV